MTPAPATTATTAPTPIEAWYMTETVTDQTAENRCVPNEPADSQALFDLGVLQFHVPVVDKYPQKAVPWEPSGIQDPALKKIRESRGYNYADIITCSEECLPDYSNKLKAFFQEHIHSDEEVRYILGGSGYFDVRDRNDRWIRIRLHAGDLIVLPEGIYHRFTMDEKNFTHAMRLFKGVPVWTAINRPADDHQSRQKFITNFSSLEEEQRLRTDIADCLRSFYTFGWCLGSSGAMSAKVGGAEDAPMLVTPSGVPKEKLSPDDLFLISASGEQLKIPTNEKVTKVSDSADIFEALYKRFPKVRAVSHIHSVNAVLAAGQEEGNILRVRDIEMIKGLGIPGDQVLEIPIVENQPTEPMLVAPILEALDKLPNAPAILVRNHGVYVWGSSLDKAKIATECLAFVLDVVRQQRAAVPSAKRPRTACSGAKVVLLDVEGTTTPITFVKDKLFPYAAAAVGNWVKTAKKPDVAAVVAAYEAQCKQDGRSFAGADDVEAVTKEWIAADRKVGALKELQGRLWRAGYESGELKGAMYDDTPKAMERWVLDGRRVAIFSSGSREAQELIYRYSDKGDLTDYLSAYFDPASAQAPKQQASAYVQIALSLGIAPRDGHFCTDVLGEAQAAKEAGWEATLLLRPGNAPLPENHGFRTATSLLDVAL
eukprot:CAMPEP_0206433724 /NCGR_PEP_ID=MMETSP0324_2-20121206/8696_1 /ASSEMBLY_ACC=CAM_ASM_000836 /TAXON_ID=2866 /ORGANISM="Crypthecodinium cohnii, Strain Seligo" /LENGTH=654 /DNA_ID=CAMNT_0053900029 /DNA_START=71 /DNA_END=2035 /DNA_ORIENTATION=+